MTGMIGSAAPALERPSIRVLVADDSTTTRRILRRALTPDAGFELVAAVPNGRLALHSVQRLRPDVIVLDVEMPVLDGLETVAALRRQGDSTPVVMFSAHTARGASAAIDALLHGAQHCVVKPSTTGLAETEAYVRSELVPVLRALAPATASSAPARIVSTPRSESSPVSPAKLVVVAVSTGGPNALREVIPRLPKELPVPVLIVQHMPPLFTETLARHLDAESALSVAEARDGVTPRPGEVWIAPGDFHLEVRGSRSQPVLHLHQGPREHSCRPAADVLFRSAAQVFGGEVLGVVMTGMGVDGALGAESIVKAGGRVVVQDAATSTIYGMPRQVVELGLADAVAPLHELAPTIVSRVLRAS